MEKQLADRIIAEYARKLYGFALAKTHSIDKAEELAARIVIDVYVSLRRSGGIHNVDGYIHRVAQNVYARYLNEGKKNGWLSLNFIGSPRSDDLAEELARSEEAALLRREIAYLSRLQREIVVLHYFEHQKLQDIARRLRIPLGTVKWHLYDAKNSMREGLNMTREMGVLGMKPIRFANMGHSGSPGALGATEDFFRSALTQNIAYAAYHQPRTIREIAEELGVSPVFVEDEALYLEEYGFLDRLSGDRFQTNVAIMADTEELDAERHALCLQYAGLLGEAYAKPVLQSVRAWAGKGIYLPVNDVNLLAWALVTYACSQKLQSEKPLGKPIEDYKVKRKDGGEYVAFAMLERSFTPGYAEERYLSCGNMNRSSCKYPIEAWQFNTAYDSRDIDWRDNWGSDYESLYEVFTGRAPKEASRADQYQRLYDKGYLLRQGERDVVNLIVIQGQDTLDRLLPAAPAEVRELQRRLSGALFALGQAQYPKHMWPLWQAMCDSWLYTGDIVTRMLERLVAEGALTLPAEVHRPGLNTILFSDTLPK